MVSTLYFILCTLYLIRCTLYVVLCTLYFTLCTLHFVLYTMYFTLCTLYFVLCTLYFILCTLYFVLQVGFWSVTKLLLDYNFQVLFIPLFLPLSETWSFILLSTMHAYQCTYSIYSTASSCNELQKKD